MRILRSDDRYPPATAPSPVEQSAQVGAWSLHVRFGQITQETTKIVGLFDVGRNLLLDYFGFTTQQHLSNRDQKIDQLVSEYTLADEWSDPASLYITITAKRQITCSAELITGGPRHFWLPESDAKAIIEAHEMDAEAVLGFVIARSVIGPPYRHTGPTHPGCPRFILLVDGREPSPLTVINLHATATVTRSGWDETYNGFSNKPLSLSEPATPKTYKLIGQLGSLYLQAYNETNDLLRFMSSYTGLEVIVGAIASTDRARAYLVEMLAKASALGTGAIDELLWPKDVRDTDPNRSVRFRFAMCAAVLSPETAAADIKEFSEINTCRNSILHGRMPSVRPPTSQAFQLLDRYCVLAASYLADDHEPN